MEDAQEYQQLIQATLEPVATELYGTTSGEDAVELARTHHPDLIVLDIVLPGMDGIEVCRQIRTFSDAYIIMLTGKSDEVDKLVGLAVGADDYLTKPFSPRELAARVAVLQRRPRASTAAPTAEAGDVRTFGRLRIDIEARDVTFDGEEIDLTRIEFDLLDALSGKPHMVFSREMLFEQVWQTEWIGDTHLVAVHIANLRGKIDQDGVRHIKTVRGIGYRMKAERTD